MDQFKHLSFPKAPLIKTLPPGPKSQEFLEFQSKAESSAVSYPRGMPMALRRAKGATVEDVDGNIYLDFFGGAGVLGVGHSNPQVIQAASQQIKDLTHSLDVPNPARRSLVQILSSFLPPS
ncbi:MAG: aminotransferase class III-fold pyridoxal phosphate-dependent enzyme, partial [Candidatus Aminicenantes bacterium]|nr:aminotransferase class III-fold pyridoxal phosphate-dependent enzyme [Candidatus Aminicenantes bacterium]